MEYSILESIVEDFRVAYLGEMEKKKEWIPRDLMRRLALFL